MQGEMLWFNTQKEFGIIRTEDGERLDVHVTGFLPNQVPEGRCAKKPVTLTVLVDDVGRRAVNVSFVDETPQHRARLRHQRTAIRY